MSAMASQITSLTNVCLTVYSGTVQRKHQSSASLAFVREIHRWPVNSLHKGPVTRKMFPFDDVIMTHRYAYSFALLCCFVVLLSVFHDQFGTICWMLTHSAFSFPHCRPGGRGVALDELSAHRSQKQWLNMRHIPIRALCVFWIFYRHGLWCLSVLKWHVYPFLLWWLREYIYFVLLSWSNLKYELLPIV